MSKKKSKIADDTAAAAIMPEDLEFDRELERMAQADALPPDVSDREPHREVTREIVKLELLSDAIDVAPAASDEDLRVQIHQAKMHGCDSIEATLGLCKRYCQDPTLEQVGYFIYHDIKVYITGQVEKVKARDGVSIQERVFGKPA